MQTERNSDETKVLFLGAQDLEFTVEKTIDCSVEHNRQRSARDNVDFSELGRSWEHLENIIKNKVKETVQDQTCKILRAATTCIQRFPGQVSSERT